MTLDQLTAKKQELQQKKAESQRQANLDAIRVLDPDAAASLQNSDAASIASKLSELQAIRANLEATARGWG